jgi:hypothetical protein
MMERAWLHLELHRVVVSTTLHCRTGQPIKVLIDVILSMDFSNSPEPSIRERFVPRAVSQFLEL